ncbi:site-specific integrase [Ascidiaceihabitans sp.]|nr:site-specific integrase [Ascidiaceihabitans sp.]
MLATKSNNYTFQKSGIWYFSRRVPADLRRHYRTARIAYSLRTKSVRDARVRAMTDAAKLDRHWHILRISSDDLPGKHLLADAVQEPATVASIDNHSFKAAVAVYLRLKGNDRPPTFEAAVRRSCGYLIDCCGMKDLHDYVRSDATKFRDYLFAKGLNGASVARIFGTVRAVINLALSEFGLAIVNPFPNVYFDHNVGVKKRHPVKPDDIKKVQEECYKADDEKRWLIALIADTGMRLAEGAGLLRSDFIEQDGILCVNIRPHPWRSLKTASSERVIPLVGSAKWAAERILAQPDGSAFAFPNYNDGQRTNANSASAALNKWMKTKIRRGYTIHSFRHSMRDRLRAVECPSDVIDQIGGWLTQGVGASYGEGYSVGVLQKWMHYL